MNEETFHGLADDCFNLHPERILFYDTSNNRSFSYAEGSQLILRTSQYLSSQGFSKGDIIISYAPLCIESVMLCWASLYAGLVFVPADYNWPADLLAHIIEETDPGLILTGSERIHTFNVNRSMCSVVLTGKNKPENYPALSECIENSPSQPFNRPGISPADLAVILYTSGSTGIPKGVMLSHQALFKSGSLFAMHFGWQPDDVFMNLGDLHTLGGIKNTCFAPLHAGAYLAHDQLRAFYSNYNIPVLNLYGSTETTGLCTGHNLSTFNPDDNSIGPAVGAQLIIEPDPSYGNDVNTGELLVKSDKLMSGYYKRETETNLVLKMALSIPEILLKKEKMGVTRSWDEKEI